MPKCKNNIYICILLHNHVHSTNKIQSAMNGNFNNPFKILTETSVVTTYKTKSHKVWWSIDTSDSTNEYKIATRNFQYENY